MMQIALRMDKIKPSTVEAADQHNRRLVAVKSANPDGEAYRIYGDKGKTILELLEGLVESLGADMKKIKIMNGQTPDKQTTIVNEWVLSASPEYFRPGRAGEAGVYDQDRVDAFVEAATQWAQKRFGKNLLAIDVHLDETTPHLHISTAPLVSAEKNLRRTKAEIAAGITKTATLWSFNSSSLYTPEIMKEFQTDIAEAMSHLGLQRGVPSEAKHETVREFYRQIHILSQPVSEADRSVNPEGQKFKEKFDIDEPDSPSPFNFKETAKWVAKAFKIITSLKSIISREVGISDKLREQSHDHRVAAEWHMARYQQLRQAQVEICEEFGNDPELMLRQLKLLAEKAQDDYERGLKEGEDKSNKFHERMNSRNEEANQSIINNLSNKLDKAIGERDKYRASHDTLEKLKDHYRSQGRTLDR